jgi:hypothetical protein
LKKKELLKRERGVSFEEAVWEIEEGRVMDLIPHPSRANQRIFIVMLHGYAYAVPFVTDDEGNYFLKTLYPPVEIFRKNMEEHHETRTYTELYLSGR